MANPFENIRAQAGDQDRSFNWYMRAVKKMGSELKTYNAVSRTDIGEFESTIEPGNMYMFVYDPKLKDSLPYYDNFPLVMPFNTTNNGFIGLNLHYLAPLARAALLGKLLDYTDNEITSTSKFQISWSVLNNFSRFPEVQPSVKKYITSNVNSRLLKVAPEHWKAAIFLPTQNFIGASTRTVHENSNRMMR